MSAQTLVRKRFVIYFDEGFVSGESAKIVYKEFFTKENGFRPAEVIRVSTLAVDEIMKIPVGATCKIWRVK